MIGQTLSHFKVTAKLGEGGMGAVYRAEDSKLGREVAIKVLPETVAQDPERLARFEREAKVLASLNHSNIAAIYSFEKATISPEPGSDAVTQWRSGEPVDQSGDQGREEGASMPQSPSASVPSSLHFLVMELVEGEDLKERLSRGPMEVEEVLAVGFQVAEALEAAHHKGIVHRDLKPANVKVTPDGEVKVLDFGLAKALDHSVGPKGGSGLGASDFSMSPTLTAEMTQAGVILGTAAYMSPEQARGKPVDKRADVWAFGVLLWEMLTARLLFDGATVTDVIAAVVTKEPDPEVLPAATPPELERLLIRCLRKDPSRRFPDIGAARVVIQDILTGTTPELRASVAAQDGITQAEPERRRRGLWLWATAALVAAGIAAGAFLSRLTEEPSQPQTVRFAVAASEDWTLSFGADWPVPSPSGDRVVYRASRTQPGDGTESALWIRSLGSLTSLPVGGTEGASSDGPITWSPDGGSILFRAGEEARILDLANGTVRTVAELPRGGWSGASWNDSGTLIFNSGGEDSVIYSVRVGGGEARPLTSLDASRQEIDHFYPQFLPDGHRFLFMVHAAETENTGLFMASLDEPSERRRVVDSTEWTRYEYTAGHLLFVEQGTLLAQPFDLKTVRTAGSPVPIASPVASAPNLSGLGRFGASEGGTLAYLPGSGRSGTQLLWRDREGKIIETVAEPGNFGQIALSPDGRNLALEILDEEGQFDLWVMDVVRGVMSRVTATPEDERDPVWSPDGRSLAYIKRGGEGVFLCRKGLRTSDSEAVVRESTEEYIPESWSGDGKTLLVVQRTQEDQQSIWALTEGADPRPILTPGFRVDEPQISPDGKWLAYVSPESDEHEVYLEPFDQEGERVRVSLDGGGQPKWRGDSRELFFTTENRLMAVDVSGESGRAEVSLPQELFEIDWLEGPGYDDYAVSADGERFLVKTAADQAEIQLQIVTNWTGLLD